MQSTRKVGSWADTASELGAAHLRHDGDLAGEVVDPLDSSRGLADTAVESSAQLPSS